MTHKVENTFQSSKPQQKNLWPCTFSSVKGRFSLFHTKQERAVIWLNFPKVANVAELNSMVCFTSEMKRDRSSGVQQGRSLKKVYNHEGTDPYRGRGWGSSWKGHYMFEISMVWWMAPFMCYVTTQRGEGGHGGEKLNTGVWQEKEEGARLNRPLEGLSVQSSWWQGPNTLGDVYSVLQI